MNQKKHGFLQGALAGALTVLLVIGLVACGTKGASQSSKTSGNPLDSDTQKKISQIQKLIDKNYLNDIDSEALKDGILKGYVDGLDDPYSVYYNEEETKALNETTQGEYDGIGAVLTEDAETGIVTIVQVYENSPAEKAGVKANDILYKVDGTEMTGLDLNKVVTYIKGDKGTEVKLTVLRGNDNEQLELTATRDKIEAQTVSSKMLVDNIGYIRVTEFDTVTSDQYEKALKDLENQGMTGLIVDLRNNPGGNVSTVCEMLDQMLPEGLIVYTQDKDGKKETAASDDEHQFTKPLVVLMNGNSASASEIYAGAIQDYGIGKIVGTQSYGKGVVQQIFDLGDGTSVKLTIADYYTPKGRNINGKGITPDVKIEYQADESNPDADNQLDKAVEVLKSEE